MSVARPPTVYEDPLDALLSKYRQAIMFGNGLETAKKACRNEIEHYERSIFARVINDIEETEKLFSGPFMTNSTEVKERLENIMRPQRVTIRLGNKKEIQ